MRIKEAKKVYEHELDAQLWNWDAEIETLKARADLAPPGARIEYLREIEKLRALYRKAEEQLVELMLPGGSTVSELQTGIEKTWQELNRAVKLAYGKIHRGTNFH